MLDGQSRDQLSVAGGDDMRQYDQAAIRLVREACDSLLDSGRIAYAGRGYPDAGRRSRFLSGAKQRDIRCGLWVHENRRPAHARRGLLQYLHPFAAGRGLEIGEPRRIAARSREALDEATAYRISDLHEYSRDGAGFLAQRRESRIAVREHNIRRQRDQFHCVDAQAFNISAGETVIETDIMAVAPTELCQPLAKRH